MLGPDEALSEPDARAFRDWRAKIAPQRTQAFSQELQGKLMAPEGGLRGASLGSGVVVSGEDLRRRAQAQAARGGAYGGGIGNIQTQQLADDRAGLARFRTERMRSRQAIEDARLGAAQSALRSGFALGGNLATGVAGEVGSAVQQRQDNFDAVATAYLAANPSAGYGDAVLYATDTVGYDPYERSGRYPFQTWAQIAGGV